MINKEHSREPVSLLESTEGKASNWFSAFSQNPNKNHHPDCTFDYQSICRKEQRLSAKGTSLKRVDFVLEKSYTTYFNYLCFFSAHSSYWNSDCLVHFILKQIYNHE